MLSMKDKISIQQLLYFLQNYTYYQSLVIEEIIIFSVMMSRRLQVNYSLVLRNKK